MHDGGVGAVALKLMNVAVKEKLSLTTTSSASFGPSLVTVAVNVMTSPGLTMPPRAAGLMVVARSASRAAKLLVVLVTVIGPGGASPVRSR